MLRTGKWLKKHYIITEYGVKSGKNLLKTERLPKRPEKLAFYFTNNTPAHQLLI